MNEEWKDIKGFEGLYQISNLRRVKSLKRLKKNNNGTRYNRHKENPWWGDKAPDVIFSHILEIIKKAEEKKKKLK